jgi:hypothetical protein
MNCKFSETQFSFCFTFEYIKQFFPIIPLPIFPNIVQEGRRGGGYDVRIAGNIFFQFKIPTYHNRQTGRNGLHWAVYGHPYYKIKLNTNSRQFELLKALQLPRNKVFYATPEFHTQPSLTNFYQTEQIVANSALFPIQNFPPYRSGHHNLIYHPTHDTGQLFSEPTTIKKIKGINPFDFFKENPKDNGLTIYRQAIKISKILSSIDFKINGDISFNDKKPVELVESVHNILLTKYNIHWYPVIL